VETENAKQCLQPRLNLDIGECCEILGVDFQAVRWVSCVELEVSSAALACRSTATLQRLHLGLDHNISRLTGY
jgi:hypothetical protein